MADILICDYDEQNLDLVKNELVKNSFAKTIYTSQSLKKAIQIVKKNDIDISIFIISTSDIDKYIETMNIIKHNDQNIKFIVISKPDLLSQEILDINPYDYMIKPINFKRLNNNIKDLSKRTKSNYELNIKGQLIINYNKQLYFINLEDIIFIEKHNKLAIIHTENKKFKIYESLKNIERVLDNSFFRTHRSYIVNLKKISHITCYNSNSYLIFFNTYNKEAFISLSKYKLLKKFLTSHKLTFI
ncbi:LytTR family two component transcriptional regulator [Orenia metallireducens]|uniref:Stage 0 sporulation protein A homolog n=1 Tax=Orenia metallireducens TaxID=1413210 RepID=A0A285I5S2_9FIRM|nr:LytTR family DNA-binding domain-containing protein [Orenia metallireducens]PRX23121.1 LytTR family two component transcriptional regulator [Orenia metallireducens]SNY42426.1 two component transcriptional regulator, LytTR family [Orenia metallireducens]